MRVTCKLGGDMKKEYRTKKRELMEKYLSERKNDIITADELYEYLLSEDISINISTIYRYFDKLKKENKIIHIPSEDKKSQYQYIGEDDKCFHHLHMKCVKCGAVKHFDCYFMNEVLEHLFKEHEFVLDSKNSYLSGRCKNCRG